MAAGIGYLRFTELEPRTLTDGNLVPEPRSGHRIIVDSGNLYSIGGYNPDFNDRENDADTYYPLFKVRLMSLTSDAKTYLWHYLKRHEHHKRDG
jgi:hypothetical protein